MSSNSLLNTFVAAIQASLSVLLVVSYGALAVRFKLLDNDTAKNISKLCVRIFLPALLFTQIGNELHTGSAHRYLVILVWALLCHLVSFLIGVLAYWLFKLPNWVTVALMFNNTTSYPLLLVQSLTATGILDGLTRDNESTSDAIERAKSYFLVFSTVSSCLTFAVGPRLIDSEHTPEDEEDENEDTEDGAADMEEGRVANGHTSDEEVNEHTSLIQTRLKRGSLASLSFFLPASKKSLVVVNRHPFYVSEGRWLKYHPRTRWWLLFLNDFFNAPLVGAALGAIIGLIPATHRAFFNETSDGGIFTAWLSESLKNVGQIFVPLPLLVAGVSLYTTSSERGLKNIPWLTALFILIVRFVLWPVASIGTIYLMATKTNILSGDPMLWFTMMLMPAGPPAMKLITMVQVSDAGEEDEDMIVKILTLSYIISPILAFTVAGGLNVSLAAVR
ncbi:auxin efflux carrier [Xylogone sp. PMI_703]|nr:auxin efflux carrier [Xylogone sp. PMI_703]